MPQLSCTDKTVAVLVKYPESLSDLFLTVCVLHFAGHHREELGEVDSAVSCEKDNRFNVTSQRKNANAQMIHIPKIFLHISPSRNWPLQSFGNFMPLWPWLVTAFGSGTELLSLILIITKTLTITNLVWQKSVYKQLSTSQHISSPPPPPLPFTIMRLIPFKQQSCHTRQIWV